MRKIVIIGGGAAGLAAAYAASLTSKEVILVEKNEKLGKKIYITGKGRCNVTNALPINEFLDKIISNPKFTYSIYNEFNNVDLINFLEANGCKTKVERGNRVFPASDHASSVTRAFERVLDKNKVKVLLNTKVEEILTKPFLSDEPKSKKNSIVYSVRLSNGDLIACDAIIIATGGLSYPTTGSTGDGYKFASETGHKVTALRPSLVPIILKEDVSDLEGLSLRNVELSITYRKKKTYIDRGEMVFTHDGISGPLCLSASAIIGKDLEKEGELKGFIDLKPALDFETLDKRVLREFEERKNASLKNVLGALLPSKIIPSFIARLKVSGDMKVHDITKELRNNIVNNMKRFEITVCGLGKYNQAVVTQGGVSVKDINAKTMESKYVDGLYFAGEVIDVDCFTGGFNLQFAFSSGYVAGKMAALNGGK
jgi:predicted Rossmann fold flavoprotein